MTYQLVRHCRNATEFQIAYISYSYPFRKYKNPKEREVCPPPPLPPPPPPRDTRLFWGSMAALVLAGGFAAYAKRNPEVRDWLTLNAPWFDDLIAIAYRENMTYSEFAFKCIEDLRKSLLNYFADDTKPKQCSLEGGPVDIPEVAEELTPCQRVPPPLITKDICEIEKCIKDLGDKAINNYRAAKRACANYNKLVEEMMLDFSLSNLDDLHTAMGKRGEQVKDYLKKAACAKTQLDELTRYFSCGVDAPKDEIDNTKCMIKDYQNRITSMKSEYEWEHDKSIVMDRQWQKVGEFMGKYVEENQSLFPGLKYDQKKPSLPGDPDLLLYHAFRYIQLLKRDLGEAVAGMTDRINRGLETLPQGDNINKAREAVIDASVKKRLLDMDKEFKKRYDDQRCANEKMLKDAMKKQTERHEETLQIRMQQKEKEATEKLNKLVEEKVASEKKQFANQLAETATKLKVVEDKLNARLKAERETKRSQELWTAGAALLAATKKGEQYVKVDKELKAIEKASGDDDKLVLSVLKAIPDSVREKGVVPESVLRQKYHVMERTALKVALVEQEGGTLPVYMLSWLQSALLFMKIPGIPQQEYDKIPEVPPKDLDTFDLLQRARFWIDRGNLAAAVRYVSSLEGASRAAAAKWQEAARSHLETRQAAEAVLAHAAALGLQYI
ncbi:hypothetical protein O3G_MSEX014619 [Manduca sexta]|uniref:MICOS complex subunit MIC60 n=1 Tax=Manduca sexta TaxID=7130 RepID=A0A921ZVY7_MANSE|nr:hypothetical protein O3G_MSEX014619 [Manduca sexta]